MSSEIIETAVNWDHDTGEIVISTRKRSIASKLKKLGLVPTNDEGPTGYSTFHTTDKQILVGFRCRKQRKQSKAQLDGLARARAARGGK